MPEPSGPKVLLLIEDEATLSQVLKGALEKEGFSIRSSSNAEDAMRDMDNKKPDLVLLDLLLPGMNGMHFLKNIRAQEWGKDLPVIILTNVEPDDKVMAHVVDYHPAYYIIKSSTTMDDIVAKVKSALSQA